MRLFLIAFALSAGLTIAFSASQAQAQDNELASGSTQPMSRARFEMTPSRMYIMQRARAESEHRDNLLRYYDLVGFNYGQPEIAGTNFYSSAPPMRSRRVVSFQGNNTGYIGSGFGF